MYNAGWRWNPQFQISSEPVATLFQKCDLSRLRSSWKQFPSWQDNRHPDNKTFKTCLINQSYENSLKCGNINFIPDENRTTISLLAAPKAQGFFLTLGFVAPDISWHYMSIPFFCVVIASFTGVSSILIDLSIDAFKMSFTLHYTRT